MESSDNQTKAFALQSFITANTVKMFVRVLDFVTIQNSGLSFYASLKNINRNGLVPEVEVLRLEEQRITANCNCIGKDGRLRLMCIVSTIGYPYSPNVLPLPRCEPRLTSRRCTNCRRAPASRAINPPPPPPSPPQGTRQQYPILYPTSPSHPPTHHAMDTRELQL